MIVINSLKTRIIPRKGAERTDDGDEREAPDIFPGHG